MTRAASPLTLGAALPEAHDGRHARALVLTILSGIAALLLWAAVTPVNEITSGSGVIRTLERVEQVEHPDGGVVAAIAASVGQAVAAGAPLLTFDTGSLERELSRHDATRAALSAERGRLAFVLENKGRIPRFTSLDQLSAEELLFWAEQSYLEVQLGLIAAERAAIVSDMGVLAAREDSLLAELAIMSEGRDRARRGEAGGVVARNALDLQERDLMRTERAVIEIRGERAARENALQTNDLNREELLARRQREAALRRAEIEEKLTAAELGIAEVQARIDRARVTASVPGTVMQLAVSHPNQVVAPGEVIAEIVPLDTEVRAEVEIAADRIGAVEIGMEARLKVLTYDFTRYGELAGRVAAISPSSYLNDRGGTVYRVEIAFPEARGTPALAGRPLRPGMTVTADILSDSKKILTYLFKPLRALGDRAFTES